MLWNFSEDMAKFVDNYPQYRKMHGNVSKHVTLVTEMSKIVEERKLMLVSETEQELACNGGQGAAFEVNFILILGLIITFKCLGNLILRALFIYFWFFFLVFWYVTYLMNVLLFGYSIVDLPFLKYFYGDLQFEEIWRKWEKLLGKKKSNRKGHLKLLNIAIYIFILWLGESFLAP